MATMPADFYTLVHRETGRPFRRGGPRSKLQVLAALRPMGERQEEWQVIGWVRDRWYEEGGRCRDVYRIGFEVDAGGFWWAHHPPPGVVT